MALLQLTSGRYLDSTHRTNNNSANYSFDGFLFRTAY
jgi:hypothetical protein